ncbi:MAG: GIY-YIG nuclease family protein [Candidatus Babeliales bacterium]
MFYVYFLKSLKNSKQAYIGYSTNVEDRLETHNSGRSIHTAKYRPWELIYYIAFKNSGEAREFETYLKTPSGKAFALRRLLPK